MGTNVSKHRFNNWVYPDGRNKKHDENLKSPSICACKQTTLIYYLSHKKSNWNLLRTWIEREEGRMNFIICNFIIIFKRCLLNEIHIPLIFCFHVWYWKTHFPAYQKKHKTVLECFILKEKKIKILINMLDNQKPYKRDSTV